MTLTPATQAHLDAVEMLMAGASKDDVIAELQYKYGGDLWPNQIENIVEHAAQEHQTSQPSGEVESKLTLCVPGDMSVKNFQTLVFELKRIVNDHGGTLSGLNERI